MSNYLLALILSLIVLVLTGYAAYRARPAAQIERMTRQLDSERQQITFPLGRSGVIDPLVDPAPDAFPLHYRSSYIPARSEPPQGGSVIAPVIDPNEPPFPDRPSLQNIVDSNRLTMGKSVARYYPASEIWEMAPYPQTDAPDAMVIECEVLYESL